MTDQQRSYFADLFDAVLDGVKWGALIGLTVIAVVALTELAAYTQATYALARDMRSEIRSRLPLAEAKETE
jgi:hypothetical protein